MKADLLDHRKFLRLARLLGEPKAHVIGYLILMWRRGYQTGNPLLGDALDVEAAAEFTGEPGKFATAAHSAGFIDRDADERYLIHDLWDHAPEWARKRMARNGHLPSGVGSYCGIVPKIRHAAGTRPPDDAARRGWGGEEPPEPEKRRPKERGKRKEKNPAAVAAGGSTATPGEGSQPGRPRDEIFDFLAALTGSDPKVNGSHIGRVKKAFAAADPPYTLDELRRLADPAFQAKEMPWLKGRKPTLGEIEKVVGRVRNSSAGSEYRPSTPIDTYESIVGGNRQ